MKYEIKLTHTDLMKVAVNYTEEFYKLCKEYDYKGNLHTLLDLCDIGVKQYASLYDDEIAIMICNDASLPFIQVYNSDIAKKFYDINQYENLCTPVYKGKRYEWCEIQYKVVEMMLDIVDD